MPYLIVREPGQVAVSIPLRDGLCVGRMEPSELVLPYAQISRQHARFHQGPGGWRVRDLESANGLFVNGVRVGEGRLQDGDVLHVGPVSLIFADQEPAEIALEQAPPPPETLEVDRSDRRLRVLTEVTRAVGALGDTDELLGRMLDAVLEVLGCERATAALRDGTEREPLRKVVRVRTGAQPEGEVVVSRAILEALLVRRQAVILRDGRVRGASPAVGREATLSAMGAPLEAGGRALGFLYVDDRSRPDRFGPEDLDFLNVLARLTAAALDSAESYQRAISAAATAGADGPLGEILGQSQAIQRLRAQIIKFAPASGTNMLIRGESGTGKELVARALHAASSRARRPFVAVNCAAIPETMIEGELFGYVQGAYTGAVRDKRGRIELAHRGTLFLDEIGDLSLSAQAKMLRALQDGEIMPLGSEQSRRVDIRVIAATHKDLRREIAEGRFREDLFFRLNVGQLEVPPLRERGQDIELLACAFLEPASLNLGKRLRGFSPAALAALYAYPWPGNVRELRNEVERAAIQAEESAVEVDDLSPTVARATLPPASASAPGSGMSLAARFAALEPAERAICEEALAAARGNVSEAARLLGITRIMMVRRVERFGLRSREG